MKRKQLTKAFMIISNLKTLWAPRFVQQYFSALRVKYGQVTRSEREINVSDIQPTLTGDEKRV